MPRNTGTAPDAELVDIKYRNGRVERRIQPSKRRWTINDPEYPPNYDYDVKSWQEVE